MTKKYEKLTYEYFVRRAKEVHGDKYDYTNTIVKTYKDKVKIFCKKHQEYFYKDHIIILKVRVVKNVQTKIEITVENIQHKALYKRQMLFIVILTIIVKPNI